MNEKKIMQLEVESVMPNRFQPRISFDEKAINELSESIKQHGVIQPIVVRSIGDKYEIIAGERRYKASVLAGLTKIPAIINDYDDEQSAEVALIENIQRKDLTPLEEAVSYQKILEIGNLTQKELATKLGKEQSTISNKLRLLNLHEEVQQSLLNGKISERHARSLLKLDKIDQVDMCKRVINERLTVRKTDDEIKKFLGSNSEEETEVLDFLDIDAAIKKDNLQPEKPVQNPGFVDVDKIESEAKDIFQPEKPKKDVNELLNEKKEKEEFQTNKFFTFASEDDKINSDRNENIYEGLDLNVKVDEKEIEEKPEKEEFNFDSLKPEENIDSPNFDFSFSELNDEKEEQIDNLVEESKEETKDNNELDTNYDFNFDFSKLDSNSNEKSEKFSKTHSIDKIKTTINEMNNSGANIKVEEFDLGDMIQLIIKVDK